MAKVDIRQVRLVHWHECLYRVLRPRPSLSSFRRLGLHPKSGNWLYVLVLGLGIAVLAAIFTEIRQATGLSHLGPRITRE